MAQDIRGMQNTCALSMNVVRTIIKGWYRISKTNLKITLVCQHLAISKMIMTGSVGHVSDLPFPFNMLLKKESLLTNARSTKQTDIKITTSQNVIFANGDYIILVSAHNLYFNHIIFLYACLQVNRMKNLSRIF